MKKILLTRKQFLGAMGLAGLSLTGCPPPSGGGDGGDNYFSRVLYALADSYIESEMPSKNFGGDIVIKTGEIYDPGRRDDSFRGFVKFDISSIPSNARIDNAVFSLMSIITASSIQPIATVFLDKVLLNNWTESGLTYNNSPVSFEFISSRREEISGRFHDWNLTLTTREWLTGYRPNYGLSIKSLDIDDGFGGVSSPIGFFSKEVASQVGQPTCAPSLTIDYRV